MKLAYKILLILLLPVLVFGMPPKPDVWNRLDQNTKTTASQLISGALERGLDQLRGVALENRMNLPGRDNPGQFVLRVPVILIDFNDNVANRDENDQEYFSSMLFSEGEIETGSVYEYYQETSYGIVVIRGEVVGWYRAPQTYAYYVNRQYGLGNYPRNSQRLAADAIIAANNDIDYSEYDNDGDGIVESPFIVHAGRGAEEEPNNLNLIWSHAWSVEGVGQLDGVRFDGYTTVPENGRIGVFSHELGHSLFGLPDLYDVNGESAGIGYWSLMAYGAWGDSGRRPVHMDAWCKSVLGFIEPEVIEWDQSRTLAPVIESQIVFKLWAPDKIESQFFLAEYRKQVGFDGEIPAEGLIIYHIDETRSNNDHPWYPGHQGNNHDLVAVEQADNRYDLELFENVGDAGDPFPGSEDNRTFDAESEPGSNVYNGDASDVAIREITVTDEGISAQWLVGVEGPEFEEQVVSMREGWNLISFNVDPESNDVRELTRPLLEAGTLRFLKDSAGRFFVPHLGFNNIPFWDPTAGYYINVSEATELPVSGTPIARETPILCRQGWRTVAYYPDNRINVATAFQSLGEALIMAKDGDGRFYLPSRGFTNMDLLAPGKGYLVKMSADRELIYP